MDAAPSDRELVAACLRDESGAWTMLVRRAGPAVLHAVRRTLGDAAASEADDCAAEVMALLVTEDRKLLRSFRGESKLTTWLHVIARRTALVWKQRAARASGRGAVPETADRGPGPAELAARHDAARRLGEVLAELPERDREVLRRFYLAGESGAEIGAALGLPPKQVSVALHRAREKAARLLNRETP